MNPIRNRSATLVPDPVPPRVGLPPLRCLIRPRLHPDAAGLDDHVLAWARHADLIRDEPAAEHFDRAGFGRFAAAVFPRARQLELVAEWQVYNWIVDDQLDEGHAARTAAERHHLARELAAQLDPGLDAPPPEGGPLVHALADLWQRSAKPFSLSWRERFASHYRDFLAFTILPHAEPERTRQSELTGFIRRRRLNSGCEMSFDLIEVANTTEVPASVAATDSYRAVRLAANDAISWTNDIFSVRKETARGDGDHLAAVIRRLGGGSWQESLARAAAMVEEMTRDFLAACEDLRAMRRLHALTDREWAVVEDSLADLGDWISGSLHWHGWSPRYRDAAAAPAGGTPAYIERHLG